LRILSRAAGPAEQRRNARRIGHCAARLGSPKASSSLSDEPEDSASGACCAEAAANGDAAATSGPAVSTGPVANGTAAAKDELLASGVYPAAQPCCSMALPLRPACQAAPLAAAVDSCRGSTSAAASAADSSGPLGARPSHGVAGTALLFLRCSSRLVDGLCSSAARLVSCALKRYTGCVHKYPATDMKDPAGAALAPGVRVREGAVLRGQAGGGGAAARNIQGSPSPHGVQVCIPRKPQAAAPETGLDSSWVAGCARVPTEDNR